MKQQFTDEKTGNIIYAGLECSVSHGTLRRQDLIPVFLEVLVGTPEYIQLMVDHQMPPSSAMDDDSSEWWDSNDAFWLLNETLFDILNQYAPEGYYFGTHPGDGSDFGYWKVS